VPRAWAAPSLFQPAGGVQRKPATDSAHSSITKAKQNYPHTHTNQCSVTLEDTCDASSLPCHRVVLVLLVLLSLPFLVNINQFRPISSYSLTSALGREVSVVT